MVGFKIISDFCFTCRFCVFACLFFCLRSSVQFIPFRGGGTLCCDSSYFVARCYRLVCFCYQQIKNALHSERFYLFKFNSISYCCGNEYSNCLNLIECVPSLLSTISSVALRTPLFLSSYFASPKRKASSSIVSFSANV